MVKRYMVYLTANESEQSAPKPCVVVSPDEMNTVLPYVLIAPITAKVRHYPFRVGLTLKGQEGQIALDMLQTIPKTRLVQKLGVLPEQSHTEIAEILKQMFDVS